MADAGAIATVQAEGIRQFRLNLFGDFALSTPDGRIVDGLGRKARGLLAYLSLNHATARRDALAALLWGDRETEQARASLRQTCYELRHRLPDEPELLVFERDEITLLGQNLATDVASLRDDLSASGVVATVLDPSRCDLLRDLTGLSPQFDDWLVAERQSRTAERREIALRYASSAQHAAHWDEASDWAMALITLDPTDQEAVAIAMNAFAERGDQKGARSLFARHSEALERELDMAPARSTVDLLNSGIHAARTKARAPEVGKAFRLPSRFLSEPTGKSARLPPGRIRASVSGFDRRTAVRLGLAAIGAVSLLAAALVYRSWAQGGTTLVSVGALTTPPGDAAAAAVDTALRTSIVRHLAGSTTPVQILEGGAPSRGARLELRGRNLSEGGSIRASLELVAIPSGQVIWAESFDRPSAELDEFEDQIGLQVARELHCAYADGRRPYFDADTELARLSLAHCDNLGTDFVEAVRLDRQITQRAPGFARGWSEYAMDSALVGEGQLPEQRKETFLRVNALAAHALALDPHQGLAYSALVIARSDSSTWQQSDQLIRRGLAADPTSPELHTRRCDGLTDIGRLQDASDQADLSYSYDHFLPGKPRNIVRTARLLGDTKTAWDWIIYSRRFWPNHPWYNYEVFRLGLAGEHSAEALQMVRSGSVRISPSGLNYVIPFLQWRVEANPENERIAVAAIEAEAAKTKADDNKVIFLAMLGHIDEAYRLAERLPPVSMPDNGEWFGPELARFRTDPRFIALAENKGLMQIWEQTRVTPDFCRADGRIPVCQRLQEARKIKPGNSSH